MMKAWYAKRAYLRQIAVIKGETIKHDGQGREKTKFAPVFAETIIDRERRQHNSGQNIVVHTFADSGGSLDEIHIKFLVGDDERNHDHY